MRKSKLPPSKSKSPSRRTLELTTRKKQPNRPHFIEEWAEKCGFKKQAELVEALDCDKSLVTRWYKGTSPNRPWQLKLCALFGYPDQPDIIFEHPDTVWFSRFFQNRKEEQLERMKAMLQAAFPPEKVS